MTRSVEEVEQRLRRLGEDSQWEFKQIKFSGNKPKSPKRDDLANEITAFANAEGGVLVCGVKDSGEVQGMTREQLVALESHIAEIANDSIKPSVCVQTQHLELTRGNLILVVEVPKGDTAHEGPSGYYRRAGSSRRLMTGDEQLRLLQRRGQARYSWFDKQPIPNTGFATLEDDLWKPLLSADGDDDPRIDLKQLGLLVEDDSGALRATTTGILLCTLNPEAWLHQATISVAQYAGNDRDARQLDAREITGPVHRQIGEVMAFVQRNMREAARKTPARVDMPEYSLRAVFEAVVNAVAHRDYHMDRRRIRVAMFDDRMEISSPGGLLNGLTAQTMSRSQATRNNTLVSMLGRMQVGEIAGGKERGHFMERRGDGVRIIQRETRKLCGKLPTYNLLGDAELLLTIPAATHQYNPNAATVRVLSNGNPLPEADVLVLFPNHTRHYATTGHDGEAHFDLYTGELPMTVYVAALDCAAHKEIEWIPEKGPLEVDIKLLPDGGAVIIQDGSGALPGFSGSINPIRDSLDRAYLYTRNIAIDEGKTQPVYFRFGESLRLTDSFGRNRWIRIMDILGDSALVEYEAIAGGE